MGRLSIQSEENFDYTPPEPPAYEPKKVEPIPEPVVSEVTSAMPKITSEPKKPEEPTLINFGGSLAKGGGIFGGDNKADTSAPGGEGSSNPFGGNNIFGGSNSAEIKKPPTPSRKVEPQSTNADLSVFDVYKKRLTAIMTKHKPEKLDKIDGLLKGKFLGKEHELYAKTCKKYQIKEEAPYTGPPTSSTIASAFGDSSRMFGGTSTDNNTSTTAKPTDTGNSGGGIFGNGAKSSEKVTLVLG
eukprot:UN22533